MTTVTLPLLEPQIVGEAIRPRWEWRIFERSPCEAFATVAPIGAPVRASYELYILSARSPHNVKVRDEQIDVKRLERTTPDGLELWRPVLKRRFPISAADVELLFDAWHIAPVPQPHKHYTLDQLLRAVVRGNDQLHAVRVDKLRAHFPLGGCRAEHAVLTIAGARWETLAIEDEDPELVLLARSLLDFAPPEPCGYPEALKRITRAFPATSPST